RHPPPPQTRSRRDRVWTQNPPEPGKPDGVSPNPVIISGQRTSRLNLVAAWRESTVFTDAERAALALTEQGTRIADGAGGVTDEVWADAVEHYDEEQLAALVAFIALINATNRFAVINRQRGGDYQPAQAG
ncbi:carboxymuconolactone decarboxylase family protein, partial [Actinomadura harenae]|uniref:carboxymuconolactone decarboxylase family protein n=1 Tax=Actinomadura harenae TaxID=2483351 RepID=UPI003898EFB0